jgi:hypothetical protein
MLLACIDCKGGTGARYVARQYGLNSMYKAETITEVRFSAGVLWNKLTPGRVDRIMKAHKCSDRFKE